MNYVGYVDEISRFCVAGWVADPNDWKKSLTVDILVGGNGVGIIKADVFRQKLDELHPDATGRYAFKFYFSNALSMYEAQEILVRVSRTTHNLIQGQRVIVAIKPDCAVPAIKPDRAVSNFRPGAPVLLTTMGRTGSTAVMAVLAQHPHIVVAGDRPFEVEMGCYYAYALRTLVATGDHERSLDTDKITAAENRFHIGFNPYLRGNHAGVFKNPANLENFMSDRLPARLGSTFREIILDYYEEVARDQGMAHPILFAEKSLPERDSRRGIRFMFPKTREILLIRDPRDVVCSATSSSGSEFDRVLEATKTSARQLLNIDSEKDNSMMVLKYEDFVMDNAHVVSDIFRFVGLSSISSDPGSMNALFATHATSATPAASINRWRKDLTAEQMKQCEAFAPFLHHFGYTV